MMKIGMRTIKTAIAVSLSIFISRLLNIQSPFFAGIAAIITMQGSVSKSFQTGKGRMLGTMIGAATGLIFSIIFPENPIIIGIGIILIIYLCNLFKWNKALPIACIVFLAVILNQEEGNRLNYALYRTIDTFIGIIIAMFINYFITPPKIEEKIKSSFKNILTDSNQLIEELIWGDKEIELDCIRKELINLETNYSILKKDFEFNVYKNKKSLDYNDIFEMFESLYNHLGLIAHVDNNISINEANCILLKKIYDREVTTKENINSTNEINIIFNYHLNKALTQLLQLNNLLSDNFSERELSNAL